MARTRFVWSPDLPRYDFGPGHPMNPVRLTLTRDLLDAQGLIGSDVEEIAVPAIEDDVLELVHGADFIRAVRAAGEGRAAPDVGLGTDENPVFPEIHTAARRIVAATLAGAQSVWRSDVPRAVSVAGGMHHAMPDRASGFCVYNDIAVAIQWLLDHGARRVAYVDLDAHHGDGVERAFWDDPRVLTMSVHESGATLFPGTGHPQDIGGPQAQGSAVNLPLPAGTSGGPWLRALEAVVAPLVREFAPDVLVTQHGCDSHGADQLTNLRVSVDHQIEAARLMARLADASAGGRWLATGGGGYTVVEVVPRVWAGLVAISAGRKLDLDAPLPQTWLDAVEQRFGIDAPPTWGDGDGGAHVPFERGFDPADAVDRAVLATRFATFPHHGLDPLTA